ncbi:hypothetical protein POJ06DRAFT_282832 [Lipomyces tetrasporus]|uniref:Mandelate racemase/muconate lactonizing enzyme N-terminal domain-containing protein n=1 Tax=Lipomyces tetrasporus TaxID=54092 RepID=A0AAD7QMJ8_9ASCO|nr:uncharacterized protein POJ06DRAFT_282832 [Lipomyces tetrasporus]KAJ8098097.1 hypothetical protein POJ06DRAFT_282832 [Lipomyces tetrasporus]
MAVSLVKVETEMGIVGWGGTTVEGHSEAVEGAERLIGWEAANVEDICKSFYRGGEVLMSALAGLDIALWDIKGKTLGVSAQDRKGQGFTTVTTNAVESGISSPDGLKLPLECIKGVRSIGIDVGLEFHGRLHKTMAKQLARMPLLPDHIDELSKLYQQTTTCGECRLP